MLIEIYPKPDGMQHINLMFCEAEPDPEDGVGARSYRGVSHPAKANF